MTWLLFLGVVINVVLLLFAISQVIYVKEEDE